MIKTMDEKQGIAEIVILTIIAGVGGGVAYLQSWLERGEFKIGHFAAHITISSFCGGLVGYAFTKSFPDWSYVIAGISGVFGIQILYFVFNVSLRIFGKQAGIETADIEIRKRTSRRKN